MPVSTLTSQQTRRRRRVENNCYFSIANHNVCLSFQDTDQHNTMRLLPSFAPFRVEDATAPLLFKITIDNTLRPTKRNTLIRKFDTRNGDTVVYQLSDGGYQFTIRDIHNRDCCLLICNHNFSNCRCRLIGNWIMQSFGLNDALMLIYAFAGSFHQTLLIHASCILCNGYGYPFIAKSGTGKSTHSSLWMKHIEGAQLMNDDNPIVRIINGQARIYGSPWSGKTPCYRNVDVPLGAITRIVRATHNSIKRQAPVQAFASLLPACASMMWNNTIYDNLCNIVSTIVETTPIFTLHCLPDEKAAQICHQTIIHKS